MSERAVKPTVALHHLVRLTDDCGIFEHALLSSPRREHGYCVDDVSRGLVVVCGEQNTDPTVRRLAQLYLDFVLSAIEADGRCHNRMAAGGGWRDAASLGDWWGRAVWALGVAAVAAPTAGMRARALAGFRVAAQARSPHVRAMVFAALGAAAVLTDRPTEISARALLTDSATAIGPNGRDPAWPWPEPRMTYGNATIAEALIVAGGTLPNQTLLDRGLGLLGFLMSVETQQGHLSVTPVVGRGRDDGEPGFDQQPIEVAAIAQACGSAYRLTGDRVWLDGIRLAWAWFLGDNDSSTPMFDGQTGAGYDGLEAAGRNLNQGAESTLAMLSTAQQVRLVYEVL